jgi:hypothetical protein
VIAQRQAKLVATILLVHGFPEAAADERAANIASALSGFDGSRAELSRELRGLIARASQRREGSTYEPFIPAQAMSGQVAEAIVTCLDACGLTPGGSGGAW